MNPVLVISISNIGCLFIYLIKIFQGVIPIEKQLEYFKEYKIKVEMAVGKEMSKKVISKAAFLISAGTNDIVINYYGTLFRRLTFDIATYEQLLLRNVQQFIQVYISKLID